MNFCLPQADRGSGLLLRLLGKGADRLDDEDDGQDDHRDGEDELEPVAPGSAGNAADPLGCGTGKMV